MSCTIIIDNPGIYTLGSLVSGKVVCTFDDRENINGIRCKLRGEEKTYWTTGSGKNRRHHRGHFKCVSGDITLFGAGEIGPGEYVYPFNFTLPTNGISSSYQHRYGSIRYFIYANVDKSFALDYKDEVTLHVEIPFDFNELEYTNTLRPVTYQAEKEIGGCCCPSTFITMNMTLEKESFILGDVIKVKIDINNATDTTIYDVIVNLGSIFIGDSDHGGRSICCSGDKPPGAGEELYFSKNISESIVTEEGIYSFYYQGVSRGGVGGKGARGQN